MKILDKIKTFWAWLRADRRRLMAGAMLAVIVFSILYVVFRGSKNKVTYQTSTVTKGPIVSSVSASGQILASNFMNVDTQATGIVKAVYVKDGDKIYAGQKLAEITLDSDGALANAKAWQNLSAAQNSYRSSQASLANVYDQIKGHDTDETFTQKETRTKAEVANDNAYVALLAASLAYRQTSPIITAPVSGTVDNITIVPGMILAGSSSGATTSSNRVAVVTSEGNPLATFNVSEVDVSRVKQGQKATITLDSISGKTFTGRVLSVDKVGTVSSGVTNYLVVVGFDKDATEVLPNMAATANIVVESKDDTLLIPAEAVQTLGEINTVRVLRNGKVNGVRIEVGLSSETQIEVTSGLSEGDVVITGFSTGGNSRTGASTSPFSTFRVGGAGGR